MVSPRKAPRGEVYMSSITDLPRSCFKEGLIEIGDIDASDTLGTTLHICALKGNKKALKNVLDKGIAVDSPNNKGQTPLFCACLNGHACVVAYLLSVGANPNEKSNNGLTPAHAACYAGHIKCLIELVKKNGDLRLHDYEGRSVKDWAILNPNPKKRMKLLLFLDKTRMFAMSSSGQDLLLGKSPANSLKRASDRKSKLRDMIRTKIGRPSVSYSLDKMNSAHRSLGFGQVYADNTDTTGFVSAIQLVCEKSLRHDKEGATYNNGAFAVMESMWWEYTKVTLKRLHSRLDPFHGGVVDLLINEIEHIGKLRHPNILTLMGVCQSSNLDRLVLLFEPVEQGSLFNFLNLKMERPSSRMIQDMAMQMCNAIIFIHLRGHIHCSLTSHAISVINSHTFKLGNFEYMIEASKCQSGKKNAVSFNTAVNAVYNWMAPEIMDNQPPSPVCDMFSFCAVLWEMLHGEVPWDCECAESIRANYSKNMGLTISNDKVEDYYKIILEYGLQIDPANRQLSFLHARDMILSAPKDAKGYIADHMKHLQPTNTTSCIHRSPGKCFVKKTASFQPAKAEIAESEGPANSGHNLIEPAIASFGFPEQMGSQQKMENPVEVGSSYLLEEPNREPMDSNFEWSKEYQSQNEIKDPGKSWYDVQNPFHPIHSLCDIQDIANTSGYVDKSLMNRQETFERDREMLAQYQADDDCLYVRKAATMEKMRTLISERKEAERQRLLDEIRQQKSEGNLRKPLSKSRHGDSKNIYQDFVPKKPERQLRYCADGLSWDSYPHKGDEEFMYTVQVNREPSPTKLTSNISDSQQLFINQDDETSHYSPSGNVKGSDSPDTSLNSTYSNEREVRKKTSSMGNFSFMNLEKQDNARSTGAKPACHNTSEPVVDEYSTAGKLSTAGSMYALYNDHSPDLPQGQRESAERTYNCVTLPKKMVKPSVIVKPDTFWFGGKESVRDLAKTFQEQIHEHECYQAVVDGTMNKLLCDTECLGLYTDVGECKTQPFDVRQALDVGEANIHQIAFDVEDEEPDEESVSSFTGGNLFSKQEYADDFKLDSAAESDIVTRWVDHELKKIKRDLNKETASKCSTSPVNSPVLFDSPGDFTNYQTKIDSGNNKDVLELCGPDLSPAVSENDLRNERPETGDHVNKTVHDFYFDDEMYQSEFLTYNQREQVHQTAERLSNQFIEKVSDVDSAYTDTTEENSPHQAKHMFASSLPMRTIMKKTISSSDEISSGGKQGNTNTNRKKKRQPPTRATTTTPKAKDNTGAYANIVTVRSNLDNLGLHKVTHEMKNLKTGGSLTLSNDTVTAKKVVTKFKGAL